MLYPLICGRKSQEAQYPSPCITFDQPFSQKAMEITKENLQMVCCLGGFHILISFFGSIGNLMNGSGLEKAFEEVYSKDTIKHILSGHAVARSSRAQILAQSALVNHISTH